MPRSVRPNRLVHETSPYLQQHATNPVDWYPWGNDALTLAEKLDRPILLSIGYSACHWCHVMERECFEDEAIAELMNAHFVCIKVDREERPDLDDLYMAATLAISGSGGWPMTVFLTPEQAPFFAGTYFPPEDRHGRPGFPSLLQRIAQLWHDDRDALFRQAGEVREHLSRAAALAPARDVDEQALEQVVAQLSSSFDARFGGFGAAPKFPPCAALLLLFRHFARHRDERIATMIRRTLEGMKDGGMYDQLGGGFARYSTDERWLVPHFEKMLYDNAQLARVYTEAYQLFGDQEYARIAQETLDYVLRELELAEGGYASSSDADSEGVEGRFFVFSKAEIEAALEARDAEVLCAYFGVSKEGNWEGHNVLHVARPAKEVAAELALSDAEFAVRLLRAKQQLLQLRSQRVAPALDDKLLSSWNGLMIGAMAEGFRVFGHERFRSSAERAAAFIQETLRDASGKLLRTARHGKAHTLAYLEDYAYLAEGLLTLYEATGNSRWLSFSHALCKTALKDFGSEGGAFFQTSNDHESLLVRLRDGQDGAVPNPNAVLAHTLFRLSRHCGEVHLEYAARDAVRAYGAPLKRSPRAFLSTLFTLDALLEPPVEIVLCGDTQRDLARAVAQQFLPYRVIAHDTANAEPALQATPLLQDKVPLQGRPSCYICHDFHCEKPVHSASDVATVLGQVCAQVRGLRRTALRAEPIRGRASDEGTARYFRRLKLPKSAARPLANSGLLVGRVGFGGYGLSADSPGHLETLTLAFTTGCNLVDTAPDYGFGNSERAIGMVLGELIRQERLARDEVVLMTKLGLITTERAFSGPAAERETIAVGDGLRVALAPVHLDFELQASKERLNVECIDLVLLHNPELVLESHSREFLLEALAESFRWLEQQALAGHIGRFGVSLGAVQKASSGVGLSIGDVLALAKATESQHFAVLQVPFNVLEHQVLEDLQAANERPWLEEGKLAIIGHRPLTSLLEGQRVRFVDAPFEAAAPDYDETLRGVGQLEAEFRSKLGKVLSAVPELKMDPTELFRWAETVPAQVTSTHERWLEFERQQFAPELLRVIAAMDRAFQGKRLTPVWREFRQRYTDALEQWVQAARSRSAEASNQRNAPLLRALRDAAPEQRRAASLAQLLLWNLSSVAGVSAVLLGAHSLPHISQALATLAWPAAPTPEATLRSAKIAQA